MRARGRHALKKAGKPRQWGNCSNGALNEIMQLVLDREEYRSSEDEDYLPGDSTQRQPGASPQTTAPGLAPEEEDLSLSERKKRLKQKQEGRDRVSAPHGMWTVPLPVEVVVMILRLAGAANAAPILATGRNIAWLKILAILSHTPIALTCTSLSDVDHAELAPTATRIA